MRVIAVALVFALCAVPAAFGADRAEVVKFPAGAHSATLKSSVKGYDGVSYTLGANAGQAMSVLFTPSNASCYFNVTAPGAESALFDGSSTGNEFSGNLATSGDYIVNVYLMRNAARRSETCRYSITFEING